MEREGKEERRMGGVRDGTELCKVATISKM